MSAEPGPSLTVIDELRRALGDDAILTEGAIGERHRSDASQTGRHLPKAVLRPASVAAVAAALRICNAHRQSVVPQGGLTGLAGAANPAPADFALSLERLSGIEEIDAAAGTMTVMAGTPLEAAQNAAAAQGFLLPIDLGSRGSCQIGGTLSTNAGGIRVIRHGVTRENVLGLEAVLADGTVLTLERSYSRTTLPGMAIRRFAAKDIASGAAIEPELLFEGRFGFYRIDNMEGIAVCERSGETRITVLSDNNFNTSLQSTLLLQFSYRP